MNQKDLTGALDVKLNRTCKHVEMLGNDAEMSIWLYDLNDQVSGMVVLEKNDDLPEIPPTVSISITLSTQVSLKPDELLKLFSLNGLLFDAAITAEEVGGEWTFYLQTKRPQKDFDPTDFDKIVSHLRIQKTLIVE